MTKIDSNFGETEKHRFVVHRHQATHLHYDFRLEMGGVLKSWAVPKGPPVDAGIKRLAVMVEDLPLDYIDFSGQITEGLYGAGFVDIWDQREYQLHERKANRLSFTLEGTKLRGPYVLINTDGQNWLLIKKTR